MHPLEDNSFKRLPVITSTLNDVFALSATGRVWVVGSGGLIVYSDDGGKTWETTSTVLSQTAKPDLEMATSELSNWHLAGNYRDRLLKMAAGIRIS